MKRAFGIYIGVHAAALALIMFGLLRIDHPSMPVSGASTAFNVTAAACTGGKHSIQWESNGDTTLFISTTCNGAEKARKAFTFTAGGRVVDAGGNDLGAVPGTFATKLATLATVIDTAVGTICGAGKCDP